MSTKRLLYILQAGGVLNNQAAFASILFKGAVSEAMILHLSLPRTKSQDYQPRNLVSKHPWQAVYPPTKLNHRDHASVMSF